LQAFAGETFYRLRGFVGGPAVRPSIVEHVVLDGQQRLTALYHAIYDTGPYVYAIRARALKPKATIDDIEEAIQSFSRDEWDAEARSRPFDNDHDWIPFYSLKSAADFFGWRDEVVSRSAPRERPETAVRLSDAYRSGLEAFHTYSLPAVIVERELEPTAIARIFERVNTGGLTLTAFDLMVAKTFETGWNLRDKWDDARGDYPFLDSFYGDDGMPIIRVIAMQLSESIREGDVLRLSGPEVRANWLGAVEGTAAAIQFLHDSCGVVRPEWLPYPAMAITLARLALDQELADHTTLLRSWYLSRTFGLQYETAANTVAVEEFKRLTRSIRNNAQLDRVPVYTSLLRDATRKRRSAVWRGFMSALWMNGALSPLGGHVPADPDAAHLLPRDPNPPATEESPHLLVLNLVVADHAEVARINGVGARGLIELVAALPVRQRQAVFRSQFLPTDARFDRQLLSQRLRLLSDFLGENIGYGVEDAAS
jgi:hypothetical protein